MLNFGVCFYFNDGFSIEGKLLGDEKMLEMGQEFFFSHMTRRKIKFIYIGHSNGKAEFQQVDKQRFSHKEFLAKANKNNWVECTMQANL